MYTHTHTRVRFSANGPRRDTSMTVFKFGSAAAHYRPSEEGFGLLHRDGESPGKRETEPGSERERVQK